MKHIFTLTVTAAVMATSMASAQVRQVSTGGASGIPEYPLSVAGSDGTNYACKNEITTNAAGVPGRECILIDEGTVFSQGDGLGPAIGGGLIGLVFLAMGSSSTTTTTTTGPST